GFLGETLYSHAAGQQTLDAGSLPLGLETTVFLGSAGKFITHIAALQLVDQGIASLDEPVYKHLPELSKLPIISASLREPGYILHPQTKPVTLRQMLT